MNFRQYFVNVIRNTTYIFYKTVERTRVATRLTSAAMVVV